MLELKPAFCQLHDKGEYPRLEDMGLIGDGTTAALVSLDGSIRWLCLPLFDSEPVFCGLLDVAKGGHFILAPEQIVEARQYYELDTAVLHTEFQTTEGRVRVADAMAVRAGADLTDDAPCGRAELVRSAVVLDGSVQLRVGLEPRGGGSVQRAGGGLHIRPSRQPSLNLHLRSNRPLESLCASHHLHAGDRLDLVLSWGGLHRHHRFEAESLLQNTIDAWHRWMASFRYAGPEAALVRRSAITLKLCDHWSSGSIVAAPTSSLPAPVGGVRNWDYRYTWVLDASFSVYALRRIGFGNEAGAFLGWVLDAFERGGRARIMYDVEGDAVPDERQDAELEGYRRSAPVRWGNGAADRASMTCMARSSTARISGYAAVARSTGTCTRRSLRWQIPQCTRGRSPIRVSGKCATKDACSLTRRECVRSRWTAPRVWPTNWVLRSGPRFGGSRPIASARRFSSELGMTVPTRSVPSLTAE